MPKRENLLSVEIYFPTIMNKKPFKGKATVVSSENRLGKFDILPQHINFATLIFNFLTIETPEKEKITHNFKRGVLLVKENRVTVFLGV